MKILRTLFIAAALSIGGPALADTHGGHNWNGPYAGVGIGGRWVNADWDTKAIGDPLCCTDGITDQQSFDASGFRFNGYVGYSRVVSGHMVVALEADIGIAVGGDESKGFIPGTVFGPPPGTPGDSTSVDTEWDGALLVRAGILVAPTTLVYITGGLAVIDVEVSASCVLAGGNWCSADRRQSESDLKVGWTIGAGFEMLLRDNLYLRGEYRYSDYGSVDTTFFASAPIGRVQTSVELESHTLSIGLVRRF